MGRPKKDAVVKDDEPSEETYEFDEELTSKYSSNNTVFTKQQPTIKLNDSIVKDIITFNTFYTTQYGYEIIDIKTNQNYFTNKQVSKFLDELIDKEEICKKDDGVVNKYHLVKRIYLKLMQRIESKGFSPYNYFEIKFLKN